jgi:integrase
MVGRIPLEKEENVGRRAQIHQLTVLEERSVSVEVLGQYRQYLKGFENFCRGAGLEWPPKSNCDPALADYLDIMFLDNKSANAGEKTVASVEFHFVQWKGFFTRSRRALRGWRKEMPAKSRLPMPSLVMAGMAMSMLAKGKYFFALRMVLDFDAYLRPGESSSLRGKDVIEPVRGAGKIYSKYMVVVRDQEQGVPDKVGVFDNSIALDSASRSFLGPLLVSRVKSMSSPEDLLHPFSNQDFRKEFNLACQGLGLPGLHPYQMRHGGATEDLNMGARDYAMVKSRGRWFTDQSVRRYAKLGKVQQMLNQLSPGNLEYCRWSLANLERVFKGMAPARAP